jgi:hypothetical protein
MPALFHGCVIIVNVAFTAYCMLKIFYMTNYKYIALIADTLSYGYISWASSAEAV